MAARQASPACKLAHCTALWAVFVLVLRLQALASGASVAAPHPANERELELIARICAGEKELFYQLIEPHQRPVFFAAYSVLQNQADAEEVAQETFLKALASLADFRGESRFGTWLVQIALNEARMRLRKDRRHLYDSTDDATETDEGDYIPRDFADWREIPSESLQRQELRDALERAIRALPRKYREVFILRDVNGASIADTARLLGISEGNVKTRLLRARLQLRDALAPGFDGAWAFGDGTWKKVRPW